MSHCCPYCKSALGFYVVQHVKRHARFGWCGRYVKNTDHKIFYEGKARRCLECDEKVTSYAKSLEPEEK